MFLDLDPELNPKWEALIEVLNEIQNEEADETKTVLILVESKSTVKQLKEVYFTF